VWPFVLFFLTSALAQELDLRNIQDLQEKLPAYTEMDGPQASRTRGRTGRDKHRPPVKRVGWEKIKNSGIDLGAIKAKSPIIRLSDNQAFLTGSTVKARHYKLSDEHGFKYLIDEDGETKFKVDIKYIEPTNEVLALYRPPLKYTPAPLNIVKTEYDKKLRMLPEASVYFGHVQGDFMKDIYDDPKARSGSSNQYGIHFFTDWELPVKAGATIHLETSSYNLSNGGNINYRSISFGPQLKTKDLELVNFNYRAQIQLRVSPFARAIEESDGAVEFKFNSTDLMASLEHPFKNGWGQFVIGIFYQVQWLNFRDQPEEVSIRASNRTNNSFGLSIAQVFN
jgi:hypothetical protein